MSDESWSELVVILSEAALDKSRIDLVEFHRDLAAKQGLRLTAVAWGWPLSGRLYLGPTVQLYFHSGGA